MNRRRLTPESFREFTSLSKIELNNSGNLCSFLKTKPSIKENSYKTDLIVVDISTGEKFKVSSNKSIDEHHWIDDETLIYKVVDPKKKKTTFKIWRYPGNEIYKAEFNEVISQFSPISIYRLIVLIRKRYGEYDEDYFISDEIPIWFNGFGFLEKTRSVLYELDLDSGEVTQISPDHVNVTSFSVDKEKGKIAASLNEDLSKPYLSRFVIYDIEKSYKEKYMFNEEKFSILSIDIRGELVASMAHKLERGFSSHVKLLLFDWEKEKVIFYGAPLGYGLSRRVYHDLRGPYSQLPKPKISDKYLYFLLSVGGRYTLYKYELNTGTIEPFIDGDFVIDEFDATYNDEIVVYTKTEPTIPVELYLYKNGKEIRVTRFNERLAKKYVFYKPKRLLFKASDGVEIEGWIILPKMKKGNPFLPLIVNIHGGPKSKFGYSFMFEHQLYANNGFAVLYFNPRGSDGYTEEFADIRLRYGTRDYLDIIEGVEYTIKNFKDVDPERMGVTGISYGGFMTNWIVTHTNMFKAAISQNGISDWEAMYGTTDIGFYFVPDQIGGTFLKENNKLKDKSPVYYAKNVETPILFIHSMNDYRCYIDQAIIFHTVLKVLGKESVIALFKEGSHTFGWNGKPRARLKRYKLMLEWFEKHLKSKRESIR